MPLVFQCLDICMFCMFTCFLLFLFGFDIQLIRYSFKHSLLSTHFGECESIMQCKRGVGKHLSRLDNFIRIVVRLVLNFSPDLLLWLI